MIPSKTPVNGSVPRVYITFHRWKKFIWHCEMKISYPTKPSLFKTIVWRPTKHFVTLTRHRTTEWIEDEINRANMEYPITLLRWEDNEPVL